ncbi:hypothetical protein QE152_g4887 [Popillia japonica]|uniref:Uncharacterized protein n=1 Tax=Popillia japonica TaxID=7064 RepID=A0AAW1N0L9_POPJA
MVEKSHPQVVFPSFPQYDKLANELPQTHRRGTAKARESGIPCEYGIKLSQKQKDSVVNRDGSGGANGIKLSQKQKDSVEQK